MTSGPVPTGPPCQLSHRDALTELLKPFQQLLIIVINNNAFQSKLYIITYYDADRPNRESNCHKSTTVMQPLQPPAPVPGVYSASGNCQAANSAARGDFDVVVAEMVCVS